MPTNKELEQKVRQLNREIQDKDQTIIKLRGSVNYVITRLHNKAVNEVAMLHVLKTTLLHVDGYDAVQIQEVVNQMAEGYEIDICDIDNQKIANIEQRYDGTFKAVVGTKNRNFSRSDTVYVKITKYPEPVSAEQDGMVEGGEGEGG